MTRKNIFQLVEENYDIQSEIRRINQLFYEEECFTDSDGHSYCSLSYVLRDSFFTNWKYRGTCLTIDDFFKRANAYIDFNREDNISEDIIINNLEAIENFIKLYFDNLYSMDYEVLKSSHVRYFNIFRPLIDELENRMGLVKKEVKDMILIYPENAPLERVINIVEDENVQWELIRYARDVMSLSEKKKSLAYFATNLYIELNKNETDEQIRILLKKATNILNNLQIRHNNQTEICPNSVLDVITEEESISLCDYTFDLILTIVLLREQKKYRDTYKEFENKQKQVKNKENNNG